MLQYLAFIETPRLLCLRGFDSQLRYDTTAEPLEGPDFDTLI